MLLDTYAWIEAFKGSDEGRRVLSICRKEEVATAMITLSEIVDWALRNSFDPEKFLGIVRSKSAILPFSEEIAVLAGKINYAAKKQTAGWGMVDSSVYATALTYGHQVITGDKHFSGKTHVIMLK